MTSSRFPCSRSSHTNSHPALTSPASRRQPASQLVQALLVGIPHDSPQRAAGAGRIRYALSEAADNGHCYLPEPNLLTDAAQILEVPPKLVRACVDELAASEGADRRGGANPTSEGGRIPGCRGPGRAEAGVRSAADGQLADQPGPPVGVDHRGTDREPRAEAKACAAVGRTSHRERGSTCA